MASDLSASLTRLLLGVGAGGAALVFSPALLAQQAEAPATITPADPGTSDGLSTGETESGVDETTLPATTSPDAATPATPGTDAQDSVGERPIGTDADQEAAAPDGSAVDGSPSAEGEDATVGDEAAAGQDDTALSEGGPVQQIGAPVPSASYDSYQSQLGLSGIGVAPSRGAAQADSGLVLSDTLDRYRSLAAPSQFARGATVLNRRRQEYDAIGLQAGSFTIFPVAGVEANYTSNVLRQDNSVDDVYGIFSAEALVRSDWARHQLLLNAAVNNRSYATYTTEDRTTYSVNGGGRVDLSDAIKLFASASNSFKANRRRSVVELIQTRSPVKYHEDEAEIRLAAQGNRLKGSLGVAYQRRDFRDARALDGSVSDQQFRDFESWAFTGEVAYEVSPGRQLFLRASDDQRRFRVASDRDVDVIQVLGGVSSEITPLISGRIGIGYLWGDFTTQGVKTRSGLTFVGNLTYLASDLTTMTLEARRELSNVANPGIANAFLTSVDLGLDHELYRNVIVSGTAGYRRSDFTGSPLVGEQYSLEAGPKWLINRTMQLDGKVGYSWFRNNGQLIQRRSDTLEISMGLTFQL